MAGKIKKVKAACVAGAKAPAVAAGSSIAPAEGAL